MADFEIVNEHDREYADGNYYLITLAYHYTFKVYETNLQDALEVLGVYCKEKGYNGLLGFDYDELIQDCDNNDDIFAEQWLHINGGEFYLNTFCMSVEEGCDE